MLMNLHLPYKLLLVSIFYSLIVRYLFPATQFLNDSLNLTLSAGFVFLGIIFGFWVKKIIKDHKTTLNPYDKPTFLITSGPFKHSRNPMYLSYVIIAVGSAIFSGSLLGFVGPILYFLYLNYKIIPREERRLTESFPANYEIYTDKVRRWL